MLLPNGNRARVDKQGDLWANDHRAELANYFMSDVDALFGIEAWGAQTGDKLFMEYEPDAWENRRSSIRSFGVVAMFDRKASWGSIAKAGSFTSTPLYLWMCRVFRGHQGIAPKFFYVCGTRAPWRMQEVDIDTGEAVGDEVLVDSGRWGVVWRALGLSDLRDQIKKWVVRRSA